MREKNANDDVSLRSFIISNSNFQDSLLQNYRLIFISSQSILIPLSALIVLSKDYPHTELVFVIPLITLGLLILLYWKKITSDRALDVSYWHMELIKYEMGTLSSKERTSSYIAFKEWQGLSKKEREYKIKDFKNSVEAKIEKKELLESPARKFMELWIPLNFYILWMCIIAFKIYTIAPKIPVIIGILGGLTLIYYRALVGC